MARPRGFNLVELSIALALSLALIATFLAILQRGRGLFASHASLASVQDTARQALAALANDVQHAGFYGFATGSRVQLSSALPPGADHCGVNFAVDLARPVRGSDNEYRVGPGARDCAPTASAGGARVGSDTLTLRHASLAPTEPRAGRIQLFSSALASAGELRLFADGRPPAARDERHEVRDLEVRTYYIANNSVDRVGWPALRVKALTESRGAAQFRDEEVMPGVEDLQVEFGVVADADGVKEIRFVSPGSVEGATGEVVAVRLWLRVRADSTEPGYLDSRALHYSNVGFTPDANEARQRRMLVERTVALRNRL